MKQIRLKKIPVVLTEEGHAVRVKSLDENILLAWQNIENVASLIEANFTIVDSYYLKIIADNPKSSSSTDDIDNISVSIVFQYLYMHNLWRLHYKRKKYLDRGFKDNDIIFSYYRTKYPYDWQTKCGVLMAMKLDDLKEYYESRRQVNNR